MLYIRRILAPGIDRRFWKRSGMGSLQRSIWRFPVLGLIPLGSAYKLEKQQGYVSRLSVLARESVLDWEKRKLQSLTGQMAEKLTDMMTEAPEDQGVTFEQLGITTLAVDEAHHFKNISLQTHADNVAGMHEHGSRKCDGMLEKVSFVREQGGGIVFSTGTPLTNSISDLFVLQTYLQPEQMELLHLGHFNEWINAFAQSSPGFEIDIDSVNYRIMVRFSSFYNLPELSRIFAGVSDYYDGGEQMEGLPECQGVYRYCGSKIRSAGAVYGRTGTPDRTDPAEAGGRKGR